MAAFCYIETLLKFFKRNLKLYSFNDLEAEKENAHFFEIKNGILNDNFGNNRIINFVLAFYLFLSIDKFSYLTYFLMATNVLFFWLLKYFDIFQREILKKENNTVQKVIFLMIHDMMFLFYRIISLYCSNYSNLGKSLYPCLLFLNLYTTHYYYPINFTLKFISFFLTVNLGFNQFQFGFLSYLLGIIIIYKLALFLLQNYVKSDIKLNKLLTTIEKESFLYKMSIKNYPNFLFILEDNKIVSMNNNATNLINKTNSNDFFLFANSFVAKNDFSLSSYISNYKEFESQVFTKQQGEKLMGQYLVSMSSVFNNICNIKIINISLISKLIDERDKEVGQNFEGIILFSVSHEIRSQLNIINGYLEKLEEEYNLNFVHIAKNSSQILECKLGLLFDYVHILMKKFNIHLKEFKIQDLIFRLIQTIKPFSKLN